MEPLQNEDSAAASFPSGAGNEAQTRFPASHEHRGAPPKPSEAVSVGKGRAAKRPKVWRQANLRDMELVRTMAIRGNPARPRIENALRAWVEAASSLLLTKKTGHPNRMSCFTLERATRLELASRHPTNRLRRFAGTLPDLGLKTRFAHGWRQRVLSF